MKNKFVLLLNLLYLIKIDCSIFSRHVNCTSIGMKNLLYLLILGVIVACNNSPTKKPLLDRNSSITSSNAYNTLFIDSNVMENFIVEQQLDDTIANGFRNFYNVRNYQYAWISSHGFTEQTLAFRNLYDYELDPIDRKKLDDQLDYWINKGSFAANATNKTFQKIELSLTWRYINYLLMRNKNLYKESSYTVFPTTKNNIEQTILLFLKEDANHPLVKTMKLWWDASSKDTLITVPSQKIKLDQSSPIISATKKKLALLYGYSKTDTSSNYNEDLVSLLKKVNRSFGLSDSLITPALIKELNIPIENRIEQMMVNYERMKWLPEMKNDKQIVVNIPAFMLTTYENKKKVFDMNVVVGKEGSNTVMFTGDMNNIVFAPYWNIPKSIVENEILPAIENDKDYLEKNQMEIVKEENDIPVIRQLPGNLNALGKVKFLFPNSYNIYLHDTPNKEAFKKEKRALSHGCIRVEDPLKLAEWVLSNNSDWSAEKIKQQMNGDKEKWVKVSPNIPVLIYYLTSYIEEDMVYFREDIYGHDKKFIQQLISK